MELHYHQPTASLSTNITERPFQPTYLEFFIESYKYFHRNVFTFLWNQLEHLMNGPSKKIINQHEEINNHLQNSIYNDLKRILEQIHKFDICLVIFLSILLTIGRHLMTKYVFVPITRICGIPNGDANKIPESSWKLCFYSSTWLALSYYLFIRLNGEYFRDPSSVWRDYSIDNQIDGFIYVLYMIELSFYLHSLYTTLMLDERRKDTNTLMIHHILCVFLIFISYCNKCHKSGIVTLFLHDGCDILLEATKLIRYFKVQHGRSYDSAEIFVNIGFVSFLFTWLINRLYWFPIKIIYFASIYVEQNRLQVPFINLLVTMLWIILLMNFYWFTFAIRLLYKVATGQINELEDNREFKDETLKQNDDDLIINQQQMQTEESHSNNKIEDEQRKLSVDSGVIFIGSPTTLSLSSSSAGPSSPDETDTNSSHSGSFEDEDYIENNDNSQTIQKKIHSPTYNLRQRRQR